LSRDVRNVYFQAVAAGDRKAAAQVEKDKLAAAENEKCTAEGWKVGANGRASAKEEAAAAKEKDRLRAAAERAELLAAEDESTGSIKVGKVKKAKKKDDLGALLSEGLKKAPKSKAEKEAEAKKKAKAEARKKQAEEELAAKDKIADPFAPAPLTPNLNRSASTSFFDEDAGDVGGVGQSKAGGGKAAEDWGDDEISASGLDDALEALSVGGVGGGGGAGSARKESRRAAYLGFEERTMPGLREDYPGLRLAQYREKCFKQWDKSPENPANQMS